MNYRNKYELLNSAKKPDDIVDENTMLYSLQEILLLNKINPLNPMIPIRVAQMRTYINLLRNSNGYFNNIVGVSTGGDAYTSHDQYRSISIFSKLFGCDYHEQIWSKIKKGLFTYNNITGKPSISRLLHPRDIIFIGFLNSSPICWMLMPIYYLLALFMFKKNFKYRPTPWDRLKHRVKNGEWPKVNRIQKTDGELIYWCESQVKSHFINRIFYKSFNKLIHKRFGSWQKVFNTYYPDPKHPLNVLANGFDSRGLDLK